MRDDLIAAEVGISERAYRNWRSDPRFLDLVAEETRRIEAGVLKLAIAKRHKRIETLNDLYEKSLQVVRDRAEAYAGDPEAHGGQTGLLVRQEKITGKVRTVEYAVDTGLVKQIESLMERAAKETGQEVAKSSIDTTNRIVFEFEDV